MKMSSELAWVMMATRPGLQTITCSTLLDVAKAVAEK